MHIPITGQFINLFAALQLLISFAMLSQRRVVSLINLFSAQGLVLGISTLIVAYSTGQKHLVYSALLTITLKVIVLPFLLHRLVERLHIRWEVETLINIPTTMIVGIGLVIFAFNVAMPISQLSGTIIRSTLGIALACILLSFLMMLTRRKALPQVIGFLSMENSLLFAAISATYGMPMVVEFGVALDLLIGSLILGMFFFQVRETFDSLDLQHMERLKDGKNKREVSRES